MFCAFLSLFVSSLCSLIPFLGSLLQSDRFVDDQSLVGICDVVVFGSDDLCITRHSGRKYVDNVL